jgi:zona occludens toxin (predicted ATPase)
VLVDLHVPGEQVWETLAADPDAKSFVQPEALVADPVDAEQKREQEEKGQRQVEELGAAL